MASVSHKDVRIRDLGYSPGQLPTGPKNSVLDVPGVCVGQATKVDGDKVRSGVTVILPRAPADISIPCYAGMHTLNGNGEVTGSYQIKDWGYVNTPIALTNSTSLGIVYHSIWHQILESGKSQSKSLLQMGRDYGTPVVGETADWWLNDIYSSTLSESHVRHALGIAMNGGQATVLEGQHGGGAGMTCHEFLGGTGTASRVVNGAADADGKEGTEKRYKEAKYTVGVLCQSNYGHKKDMRIGGVPIGKLLLKEEEEAAKAQSGTQEAEKKIPEGGRVGDGSIVIMIFTDCPMLPHQLTRLAQRASIGLAQVGAHGTARNHSGDIFLAVSTANKLPLHGGGSGSGGKKGDSHSSPSSSTKPASAALNFEQYSDLRTGMAHGIVETNMLEAMRNECVDAVFRAASEAVEEAVLNSVVANAVVVAGGGAGGGDGKGTGGGGGELYGRKTTEGGFVQAFPAERVRALLERWLVVI